MSVPTRSRVDVTPEAAHVLRRLTDSHGPVMFHQSGGCCDGSAPMCYPVGEFLTGEADVHLGDLSIDGLDPIQVWMSRAQHQYWKHTHLTIDVVPGRGAGFSLEAPEGVRFLLRSRLLTDAEYADPLPTCHVPSTGTTNPLDPQGPGALAEQSRDQIAP